MSTCGRFRFTSPRASRISPITAPATGPSITLLSPEHPLFYEHECSAMRRAHLQVQENQPVPYPRHARFAWPRARALPDARAALAAFEMFEGRFAAQVRFSILLAGLSGIYMLGKLQAWARLLDPAFWWLALMLAVWAVFALMVFVLEPLLVHRLFHDYALRDKDRAFALAIRLHAVALAVSCLAIAAGVLGAHGALP